MRAGVRGQRSHARGCGLLLARAGPAWLSPGRGRCASSCMVALLVIVGRVPPRPRGPAHAGSTQVALPFVHDKQGLRARAPHARSRCRTAARRELGHECGVDAAVLRLAHGAARDGYLAHVAPVDGGDDAALRGRKAGRRVARGAVPGISLGVVDRTGAILWAGRGRGGRGGVGIRASRPALRRAAERPGPQVGAGPWARGRRGAAGRRGRRGGAGAGRRGRAPGLTRSSMAPMVTTERGMCWPASSLL
jgi:hypothetical protein